MKLRTNEKVEFGISFFLVLGKSLNYRMQRKPYNEHIRYLYMSVG